jgi:hypothetical protein
MSIAKSDARIRFYAKILHQNYVGTEYAFPLLVASSSDKKKDTHKMATPSH